MLILGFLTLRVTLIYLLSKVNSEICTTMRQWLPNWDTFLNIRYSEWVTYKGNNITKNKIIKQCSIVRLNLDGLKKYWDFQFFFSIFQVSRLPLCDLLGGNHQNDILLYRAISQGTPDEMATLIKKYKEKVRKDN